MTGGPVATSQIRAVPSAEAVARRRPGRSNVAQMDRASVSEDAHRGPGVWFNRVPSRRRCDQAASGSSRVEHQGFGEPGEGAE